MDMPVDDTPDSAPPEFKSALRSMESQHKPLLVLRAKVAMVGDSGVGKTAIAQMFHSGGHNYPKNYVMTIGVEFNVKTVNIPNTNVAVELFTFDCAGQYIFNKLEQNARYWQNSSYVCVVYDVSVRSSFESCGKWLQSVRATRPSSSSPLPGVLIASKSDLKEGGLLSRAVVEPEEGRRFAEENGLKFFEVSAARGEAVQEPFMWMAERFHASYEQTVRNAQRIASGGVGF